MSDEAKGGERSGGGASGSGGAGADGARGNISATFGHVQDVAYVALGVVLAATCVAVLIHGGYDLVGALVNGDVRLIVTLLDRVLLALMIVELLYTVQVSFREHVLVAEPFILVALIAAVRRILIITAEFGAQTRPETHELRLIMWELGLLTVLIIALVGSLVILQRRSAAAREEAPQGHHDPE